MGATYYIKGSFAEMLQVLDEVVEHRPTWRRLVSELSKSWRKSWHTNDYGQLPKECGVFVGRILAPRLRERLLINKVVKALTP